MRRKIVRRFLILRGRFVSVWKDSQIRLFDLSLSELPTLRNESGTNCMVSGVNYVRFLQVNGHRKVPAENRPSFIPHVPTVSQISILRRTLLHVRKLDSQRVRESKIGVELISKPAKLPSQSPGIPRGSGGEHASFDNECPNPGRLVEFWTVTMQFADFNQNGRRPFGVATNGSFSRGSSVSERGTARAWKISAVAAGN